ncbi:PQQ-binding-like beta-propeller repeat protein [Streptomyces sp. NPDC096132]|uniref:protein kinase domain-containing protein n=1 Tax=Streptomyces sp. NPDC096132 TaxID=3366075 RepID=UPI00382CF6C8
MPLHKDDPKALGGYKIVDRLGAGGMGIVYRARSRSGREVALKVVHAQYAEDAVFRARFRQEIEAVRRVSGAFTAPVVDADPEAARPWMATQYVPGRSLADRIREGGPIRDAELRLVALGLVEALRDLHRAGVVHRDLKPANVLMAEDGPRVIDFGISRAAENHNTLTETGQMIGTPPFMSPEQFVDARSVGPASDVFSLGALLAYSLTGRGPFDADSPYLTAYRVVHNEPVLEGVARPLRTVLERCLAKEAKERPGLDELAREFAAVLPEYAQDEPHTMSLRVDTLRAALRDGAATDPGTGAHRTATSVTGSGRRRPWWRGLPGLLAASGLMAASLTALFAFAPLDPEEAAQARPSASPSSRWAAVPAGWKPWQTTVSADAERGVREAQGADFAAPFCLTDHGAVYCGGTALLPERIDGATGRTLWRADITPAGYSADRYQTAVIGVHDGLVLVELTVDEKSGETKEHLILGLDAKTGDKVWSQKANYDGVGGAVYSGGLVLVQDDDGPSVILRSAADGRERSRVSLPANHYCGMLAVADRAVVQCTSASEDSDDTQFMVIDPANGSLLRSTGVAADENFLGILDGQLIFLAYEDDGTLNSDVAYDRIVRVDPGSREREVTELSEKYTGRAVLRDGTIWFSNSSGRVSAVSARTGSRTWQTHTNLEAPGDVTVDDDGRTVYMATGSGRVAALDAAKGTLLWESGARAEILPDGIVPTVLANKGALVVVTADGTVFTLDPAHPDRKAVSAG